MATVTGLVRTPLDGGGFRNSVPIDIRQYGAAWWGDVWQPEARRAENHIAFHTMDDWYYWDKKEPGYLIVGFDGTEQWETDEDGKQVMHSSVSRASVFSIAGGRIVG